MPILKHTLCLLALFAVLSQLASGDHQVKQDDTEIEDAGADDTETEDAVALDDVVKPHKEKPTNWTSCDWKATSKFTCQSCNTRLICKRIGGILKNCDDAEKPYCTNGFCSAVPSEECANA